MLYLVGNDFLRFFARNEAIGQIVYFSGAAGGTATIPGTAVNENGLYYAVVATDNAGNVSSAGRSVAVSVPAGVFTHNTVAGKEQSAYRLFSVPLELDNKAFTTYFSGRNDLGTNGTEWRFFAYGGGRFIEYTKSSINQISPERGYFLITRTSKVIETKAGTTFRPSTLLVPGIPLTSGWNLVGDPVPYEIRLSDLTLDPLTDNLVDATWYWSGPGGWTKTNLALRRWEGLAIRVSSNTSLRFVQPPAGSATPGGKAASDHEGSVFSRLEDGVRARRSDESQWLVQIVARDEYVMDQLNYIGVMPDASDDYDSYDLYEPPILPDVVSFHFRKDDWGERSDLYSTDIRSPNADGHVWEATLVGDPYSAIRIDLSGIDNVPKDFDVYAIADNGMVYDLRGRSTIRTTTGQGTRKLTLVVGTKEFVASKSRGIALTPSKFALHQNYPNPFNPSTTIRYELPVQAYVTLKVYSLLGEEVATLVDAEQPAGYYEAQWNASALAGGGASGVYFYRLNAASPGSNELHDIRKMILVK